jgi:hypothetical protein
MISGNIEHRRGFKDWQVQVVPCQPRGPDDFIRVTFIGLLLNGRIWISYNENESDGQDV